MYISITKINYYAKFPVRPACAPVRPEGEIPSTADTFRNPKSVTLPKTTTYLNNTEVRHGSAFLAAFSASLAASSATGS